MEVSGTIEDNLRHAVQSAKRLMARPIYTDTLKFWHELLQLARHEKAQRPSSEQAAIDALISELEVVLSER